MTYRWLYDQTYVVDNLRGVFRDSPIFIIGGSPTLSLLPLGLLADSRLITLALNNSVYVYDRPTMWLTADHPNCFGGHFFSRPDILKFGYMNYKDEVVAATNKTVKEHPSMFLYTAMENTGLDSFFSETPELTWWKSVFPLALQLCWRLGSRRVYLVGCGFQNSGGSDYAWNVKLTPRERDYSQRTYDDDIFRLSRLKPLLDQRGFEVISCTPNSRANAILPYMALEEAINRETAAFPQPSPLSVLKHSSEHLVGKQV